MASLRSILRSAEVHEFPPSDPAIERATDLGGVQVLKHGDLYVLSDGFGDIRPDSRGLGLYAGDTRVLSCLALKVNGSRPVLLASGSAGNYRGTIQMTNADLTYGADRNPDPAAVALPQRSLGISRERLISDQLHERVSVANFTLRREHTVVEIWLDVDDADIFEVRGRDRPRRGSHLPILARDDGRITFRYDGLDGLTRWTYVEASSPEAILRTGAGTEGAVTVRWERDLAAGSDFSVEWRIWTSLTETPGQGRARSRSNGRKPSGTPGPQADAVETNSHHALPSKDAPFTGTVPSSAFPPNPRSDGKEVAVQYKAWGLDSADVSSDNELFDLVIRRSLADLRLLTTDGPDPGERYVAAGVPWYTTLFGRDSLIVGLQTLAFRPAIGVEALKVLAARQATTVDDWRDAQPGKILHELRTGEMARTGELPYTPYYGSVDSTPLWLILLGSVYDWTGDAQLVESLWPNALAALRWIDEYGTDGNGFVAYERHSPQGLVNQGWKDSGDSIMDRGGTLVAPPIALVEVQGYVFDAKRRMARLAEARGDETLARKLDDDARTLQQRFEKRFWLDDRRYYAMAIGRDGKLADAVASNPGQALWSGIVSAERAALVADRLMAEDMDSGWGVRCFAANQPGYNPIGYHTGTVWPHDNALIVAGLRRYGFHAKADQLAGKLFEAAQRFEDYRLPELFCGFHRSPVDPPVPYPVACSPQAWAAAASLHFLTSMLGLSPNAEKHELELVQPHLPDWLTRVTVRNLRVGEASVDLLFHTWRGTTSAEVLAKRGDLAVTIRI